MKKIFVLITILGYNIDNSAMYIFQPKEENFIHTFFKKKRIEKNINILNAKLKTDDKTIDDVYQECIFSSQDTLSARHKYYNKGIKENIYPISLLYIPIKEHILNKETKKPCIKNRQPVSFLPPVKKRKKLSEEKNVKFAPEEKLNKIITYSRNDEPEKLLNDPIITNKQTKERPEMKPVREELL